MRERPIICNGWLDSHGTNNDGSGRDPTYGPADLTDILTDYTNGKRDFNAPNS